jgi:hypothetical protein
MSTNTITMTVTIEVPIRLTVEIFPGEESYDVTRARIALKSKDLLELAEEEAGTDIDERVAEELERLADEGGTNA